MSLRIQDRYQAQSALIELGLITAGVAHELKNPVYLIKSYANASLSLLDDVQKLEGEDLRDLRKNLETIEEHAKRMEMILKTALLTAKNIQGTFELSDLSKVMDTHVMLAFHAWRGRDPNFNVSFQRDYAPSLGPLLIDPYALGRAILALADNAMDAMHKRIYSPSEVPTLHLALKRDPKNVLIEIGDNGTGIKKEHMKKLFQPFFSTKEAHLGTGLGLTIVKKIVEDVHKGSLKIKSEEGKGTTVTIMLPLKTKDQS